MKLDNLQHTNSLKQGEKCVDPRRHSQGSKRHQEGNLLGFYLSLSTLFSEGLKGYDVAFLIIISN